MGYVLSILMNALRTWLLTKLWDSFFTRRFNGKQFWAYWLLWTAIITVVLNVLPNDYDYSNIIRFLIEIAHEYAMNLMLYRSRWDRRLFVVITGYACFFSISVLIEKAWLLYSGMTRTEYVYNKPLYTAFIFLRGLCLVAFVILVRHFHTPPQENGKPRAWIPASTLFPLCTLFVLYRVFNAESAAGENDAWTFCLLVMCAVNMDGRAVSAGSVRIHCPDAGGIGRCTPARRGAERQHQGAGQFLQGTAQNDARVPQLSVCTLGYAGKR